jgi:DNA-binding MarR family transcriptional regulator
MPGKRAHKPYREVQGIRLDQQEWVAYRLSILHGHNARALAAMYTKQFHISAAQWRVLTVIGRHAPASAGDVARFSSLEPDKITRAVDSLVKLGLVHRRLDPRDLRFVILSLTAKGKRVNEQIQQVRNAMELEFVSALTPAEAEALYGLLDKLQERAAKIFARPDAWREILAKHLREVTSQKSLERGAGKPRARATAASASAARGRARPAARKN